MFSIINSRYSKNIFKNDRIESFSSFSSKHFIEPRPQNSARCRITIKLGIQNYQPPVSIFFRRHAMESISLTTFLIKHHHTHTHIQGCQIVLGPNISKREKYTKWAQTKPNGHMLYQMVINYAKLP
jgi:hypothetical protein